MRRFWMVLLLSLPSVLLAGPKETALEKEDREAAEEDARDASKPYPQQTLATIRGKLVLRAPQDGESPQVLGTFTSETGNQTFLVKVSDPKLKSTLTKFDNKMVALMGKFRNERKYFVVTSLVPQGSPPKEMRNEGGI